MSRGSRPPGAFVRTYTLMELASLLHVHERTLRRAIQAERFPEGIKLSKQAERVWPEDVVEAWLKLAPLVRSLTLGEGPEGEKKK